MKQASFRIRFEDNSAELQAHLDRLLAQVRELENVRLRVDTSELASLYLAPQDFISNLWQGIVPETSYADREFYYAMGDIPISQLLQGEQLLTDKIHSIAQDFTKAFQRITHSLIDEALQPANIVFQRDQIDERLDGKTTADGDIDKQLEQLQVVYANILKAQGRMESDETFNAQDKSYQLLEALRSELFQYIRQLDNTIAGQKLGMTAPQEMYWRLSAAQGAYHGESLKEAQEGEMGLSYDELVEVAKQIEDKIKITPSTDIENIARLSTTLQNLNDRIAFLGAALHLQNENFHRQTRINQAGKLIDAASTPKYLPPTVDKAETIGELAQAIKYFNEQLEKAKPQELDGIADKLIAFKNKLASIKSLANLPAEKQQLADFRGLHGNKLRLKIEEVGIAQIRNKIRALQKMLDDTSAFATDEQKNSIKGIINQWKQYEKVLKHARPSLRRTWADIEAIGDAADGITPMLESDISTWQKITGVVNYAIHVFNAVASIVDTIQAVSAVTKAASEATVADVAPVVAAVKTQAMANRELAASEFMAAHASIPFAGAGIAAGFIAQMQNLVASVAVTPFANGGLVYGPTLALMGEYAGARSNPEVIAPLSKLQDAIGPIQVQVVNQSGDTKVKIRGADINLALSNYSKIHKRKR